MNTLPGPSMLDSKLFVTRRNDPFPDLYERLWDGTEWIWVNHGRPGGVKVRYAPGGCNRGDVAAFTRGESAAVIAHELGHNLFALDDEYNNDDRAFTGQTSAPNLSEQPEDWADLKWHDLLTAGAPLPTDPRGLPRGWNRRTSVGAFEGGGGNFATGIFRPVLECRMNQNNPPWCPVCAREIERVLGEYL